MKSLFAVTLITAVLFAPTLTIAKTKFQYPQPDSQGDYRSILSTSASGKNPHLVWRIKSNQLNCRSQPGTNYPIVRSLAKGNVIDVVGKPRTYQDQQGKVWLHVAKEGSLEDTKIRCFVRANTQFIQPIPYSLV
jgi:uncharacterized protein YgiM (DUF1202 family)